MPRRPERCPHCGSTKLTFAEKLSFVIVYQCEDCGRAVSVATAAAAPEPHSVTKRAS